MKYAVVILVVLGLYSCGEKRKMTFTDLTEMEKQELHAELIDTLRSEMYDFMQECDRFSSSGVAYCGAYYPIDIQQNLKGDIMVFGEINSDNIQSSILKHFTINRSENLHFNFPPFEIITEKNLIRQAASYKAQLDNMIKNGFTIDIINFKKSQVNEAKNKLKYLSVLQTKSFKTIDEMAFVMLEYQSEQKSAIIDSTLFCFYELRNRISKKHLNKSYLEVYYNYKKHNDSIQALQMGALKWAVPSKILDINYLKKNYLKSFHIGEPPVEVKLNP